MARRLHSRGADGYQPGMQKFIAAPLNPTVAEPTLLGFVRENRNTVDLDQNLD